MGNERAGKPWTEEEKEFLEENYKDMTDKELGEELGRSRASVSCERHSLGLMKCSKQHYKPWSQEEEEYLKEKYLDKTDKEMGEKLGRSRASMVSKRKSIELKNKFEHWNKKEEQYLENNFLSKTDEELGDELGRSKRGVCSKRRRLGLKRVWRDREIQYIIDNISDKTDKEIGDELGRTQRGVSVKRRRLGFNFNKYPIRRLDLWKEKKAIIKKYKQGESLRSISKKYKTDSNTICRILDACHIEFKSQRYDYLQSVEGKLNHNMCGSIRRNIRDWSTSHSWTEYVDYSVKDLKEHLESQFDEDMTWDNYGKGGWHIDHIRPISSFTFDSPEDEDFKRCWSLCNLQPLWEPDNESKCDKWDGQIKLFY